MITLAVDPGSKVSGWAVFVDGQYRESGIVKATTLPLMGARINALVGEIEDRYAWIQTLVIERTPPTSRKPRDFYMPGLAAGIWCAAVWSIVFGGGNVAPVLVRPGEWQRPMIGKKPTKGLSKARASLEANKRISDDNEADAINLGAWYTKTHRLEVRR